MTTRKTTQQRGFVAKNRKKKYSITRKREKERKRGLPISARSFAFDRAFPALGAIARAVSCAKNPPLSWKTLSMRAVPEIRSRGASLARFLGALRTLYRVFLCALRASLNEAHRGKVCFISLSAERKT
jgi:hypothetical protein